MVSFTIARLRKNGYVQGWRAYEDGCLYLEIDTNKTTVEENSIFCKNRGAQMILLDKNSKLQSVKELILCPFRSIET